MNNWLEDYIGQYMQVEHAVTAQLQPGVLDFGVNFGSNNWGNPTWSQVLKVESNFTDAGFWGEIANGSQAATVDPELTWKENYSFTYFQKPVIVEEFESAKSGWETIGGTDPCVQGTMMNCWDNLLARAQGFYSQVGDFLNYTAVDGTKYYEGITWWTDHTGNAGKTGSFGLLDNLDNRINGVEDVNASPLTCSTPLSALNGCGGELTTAPWYGANEESCPDCIIPALALWTSGTAPTATPTATPTPANLTNGGSITNGAW
jgi:hypothetical protein